MKTTNLTSNVVIWGSFTDIHRALLSLSITLAYKNKQSLLPKHVTYLAIFICFKFIVAENYLSIANLMNIFFLISSQTKFL